MNVRLVASTVLVLAIAPIATIASGQTLRIVPSADHPTIQSAVDAAGLGDVIQVKAGTYAAEVTLNLKTKLTLKGKGKVVIDASGESYGLFLNDCADVQVENIEVRSAVSAGVRLENCAKVSLKKVRAIGVGGNGFESAEGFGLSFLQCVARNTGDSGFVLETSQSFVRRCDALESSEYGIEIDGDSNVISDCKVRDTINEGIWVHDSSSDCDANLVAKNQLAAIGGIGIFVSGDGIGNAILANTIKSAGGYGIENTISGAVVADNKVSNTVNSGYWLAGLRCTFRNNKATKVGGAGFFLHQSTDFSTVSGNSVKGAATRGFDLNGSPLTFASNTAKNCVEGPVLVGGGAIVLAFENGFEVD